MPPFTKKVDDDSVLALARKLADGASWRQIERDSGLSQSTLSRRIRKLIEALEAETKGSTSDLPKNLSERLLALHERKLARVRQARKRERDKAAKQPEPEPEKLPSYFTFAGETAPWAARDLHVRGPDGENLDFHGETTRERRDRLERQRSGLARRGNDTGLAAFLDRQDLRKSLDQELAELCRREGLSFDGASWGWIAWETPDGSERGSYNALTGDGRDYAERVMQDYDPEWRAKRVSLS